MTLKNSGTENPHKIADVSMSLQKLLRPSTRFLRSISRQSGTIQCITTIKCTVPQRWLSSAPQKDTKPEENQFDEVTLLLHGVFILP